VKHSTSSAIGVNLLLFYGAPSTLVTGTWYLLVPMLWRVYS